MKGIQKNEEPGKGFEVRNLLTFLGGSIITAVASADVSTTSNIPSAFPVKNLAFKIPFLSAFNAAYLTLSAEISIPITDSKPLEQVILNKPEPQYASTR